jgi:hypothetical protein
MHALISIDQGTFRFDPNQFLEWLQGQRSAPGVLDVVPIRTNCEVKLNESISGPASAKRITYSTTIAPRLVQMSLGASGSRLDSVLRHMVIASNDQAVPNAPIVSPATEKYCDREHSVLLDLNASSTMTVRIRCWTQGFFETDGWTVFYCDAKDCTSDDAARAVARAIASDPDFAAFAQGSSKSRQSRGPYLVSIDAVAN